MQKPLAVSVLLALILSAFLPADARAQRQVEYGVKAGYSSASVDALLRESVQYVSGASAGAFVEWRVHGPFSLVGQMQYVQRGYVRAMTVASLRTLVGRKVGENPDDRIQARRRLHYLSFPLFVRGEYGLEATPSSLYAVVGPRLEVLVGVDAEEFTVEGDSYSIDRVLENYRKYVIGASVGLGAEFGLGATTVGIEFVLSEDAFASVPESLSFEADYYLRDGLQNLTQELLVSVKF